MHREYSMVDSNYQFNAAALRSTFSGSHCLVPTSDGKILFVRKWEPAGGQIEDAAILFLHGITAHSGAYNNILATPLAKAGFPTYGLDLRGHGLSDGIRGDVPTTDRLVRDICETIRVIRNHHAKLVLLGHSVGVVLACRALSHCPDLIDGAIFLSFARNFRPGVHKKRSLGNTVKILFSSVFRPSHPVIKYSHPGIAGIGDPMYTFTYTLRFMRAINPRGKFLPRQISIPVYVGAGDHDELFTVEAMKNFYEEVPATRKTFYVLPGAKHASFPGDCLNSLFEWIRVSFYSGTLKEHFKK